MKPFFLRPQLCQVESVGSLIRACQQIDAPVVVNKKMGADDLWKLAFLIGREVQESRAFGDVRTIANVPGTRSIAKSLSGHPMHTDGTFMDEPPTFFLLRFDKVDPGGGGMSEFLPVSDLLGTLEARHFKVLAGERVRFARRDDAGDIDAWEGTLLGHDPFGRLAFRWRYDDEVRPEPVEPVAAELVQAIRRIRALIARLPRLTYAAREDDVICVPNRTWLHGRTALSPGSDRQVRRVWVH
jgi:hypothetical protein